METAHLAGLLAAKCTAKLIPLCLPLSSIAGDLEPDPPLPGFLRPPQYAQLGVKMEALPAVSVATLPLYDRAKALEKTMIIEKIPLLRKYGGDCRPSKSDQSRPLP